MNPNSLLIASPVFVCKKERIIKKRSFEKKSASGNKNP
jgi:hypothetical protein